MKRMLRSRRALVALGVLVLATAGGVAWAAIPDTGGVIHACYLNRNGALRVIDPAAGDSCSARFETAIDLQAGGSGTVASAHVGPAGELDARATGVVGVVKPLTGFYCFDLVSTPKVAVATIEMSLTGNGFGDFNASRDVHVATPPSPDVTNACPAGYRDLLAFTATTGGAPTDTSFYFTAN
jgi:hypothetical protein